MTREEIRSAIEAVLYVAGDPVPMNDLAQALELTRLELQSILDEMIDLYNYEMRGIQIVLLEDCAQFSTRREHAEIIRKVLAPTIRQSLSQAALETLSIVAYRQPITRGEIEQLRGVKCEYAVQSLLRKNLIEPMGVKDTVGHPRLYGTTINFLRTFGLSGLDELPRLEELDSLPPLEQPAPRKETEMPEDPEEEHESRE